MIISSSNSQSDAFCVDDGNFQVLFCTYHKYGVCCYVQKILSVGDAPIRWCITHKEP